MEYQLGKDPINLVSEPSISWSIHGGSPGLHQLQIQSIHGGSSKLYQLKSHYSQGRSCSWQGFRPETPFQPSISVTSSISATSPHEQISCSSSGKISQNKDSIDRMLDKFDHMNSELDRILKELVRQRKVIESQLYKEVSLPNSCMNPNPNSLTSTPNYGVDQNPNQISTPNVLDNGFSLSNPHPQHQNPYQVPYVSPLDANPRTNQDLHYCSRSEPLFQNPYQYPQPHAQPPMAHHSPYVPSVPHLATSMANQTQNFLPNSQNVQNPMHIGMNSNGLHNLGQTPSPEDQPQYSPELGQEDGGIDTLEVARQIAIEVEQEVENGMTNEETSDSSIIVLEVEEVSTIGTNQRIEFLFLLALNQELISLHKAALEFPTDTNHIQDSSQFSGLGYMDCNDVNQPGAYSYQELTFTLSIENPLLEKLEMTIWDPGIKIRPTLIHMTLKKEECVSVFEVVSLEAAISQSARVQAQVCQYHSPSSATPGSLLFSCRAPEFNIDLVGSWESSSEHETATTFLAEPDAHRVMFELRMVWDPGIKLFLH